MTDEPTPEDSSNPSGKGSPEGRSADPPPGQVERTADEGGGRRTRWKTTANRILPRRAPEPEDRLSSPVPGILLFLFLLGVAALSIFLIRPPAPLPESAPPDQFSAARALRHVEVLAARPRPIGTQAHTEAQAYLVAQLGRLGLKPQVQKTVAVRGQMVAHVENVLARLPGSTSGGKAILLVAHYDSVPTGPGAKDDGSGVAALLETARALTAGSHPLANDVIFLFSDGEEVDLHGATAFVEEHPWAKDVGLVLSLDAGDNTGPAYTAETSPNNNWLISHYAQAVAHPLASSLAPEVERHMPTAGGDFTVLRDAGYPGLGFGAIGKSAYYHTALDNLADVDLGALQHQGSYALSLVRHFGDLDLAAAHGGDAVYFNALGDHLLVHYPQEWVLPLVVVAGLVWVGALVFGLRRKQVSLRGVLLGVLASLLVAAVLAGVGYLLWRLLLVIYPQYQPGGYAVDTNTYNSPYYWLAFMALGVGLAALLHSGLRTRIRTAELALGGLLLWLVLAVGLSVWMPGASYILTWPLLFGSLGLWGWFALGRSGSATGWGIAWLALFTVPAVVLVVHFLYAGGLALSIQKIWIPMAVLGLLVGLLALHLAIIARPYKWWLPLLMGIVMVVFLVAGHLTSTYSPERPLRDAVIYGLNADQGKASWIGFGELDAWTTQFFGEGDGGGDVSDIWPETQAAYKAPAPMAGLAAPTVKELDAPASGVFRLRVVPAPGTWTVFLYAMPWPTPVTYYVGDRPIESEDGWFVFGAPPAKGFDLTVKAPASDSLRLLVAAETLGLPTIPGFTYSARPAWIIPNTDYYWSDSTWVAKTFSFGKD